MASCPGLAIHTPYICLPCPTYLTGLAKLASTTYLPSLPTYFATLIITHTHTHTHTYVSVHRRPVLKCSGCWSCCHHSIANVDTTHIFFFEITASHRRITLTSKSQHQPPTLTCADWLDLGGSQNKIFDKQTK